LILLVVWLYKKITGKAQDQTPLEILKARYAKGELTKKQFEEMKKELGG
jgi:putative membrane protein